MINSDLKRGGYGYSPGAALTSALGPIGSRIRAPRRAARVRPASDEVSAPSSANTSASTSGESA